MSWLNISTDNRFKALGTEGKQRTADAYFNKHFVADPRWEQLKPNVRTKMYQTFLNDAIPTPKKVAIPTAKTEEKDSLGGPLGSILRGVTQMPIGFATNTWRAIAAVAPSEETIEKYTGDLYGDWMPGSEDFILAANTVDNAVRRRIPQATGKYAQAPESLTGYLNPIRAYNLVMEQGPTFALLGLKGLANKKALRLLYSGVATGNAVQAIADHEAESGEKVPFVYKRVMPVVVGGISGALDLAGINEVFGKGVSQAIKGRFARTVTQAIMEGSTETMQEGVQIIGQALGYKTPEAKEVWDRLAMNAYGGLLLGGAGAGLTNMSGPVESLNRTPLVKKIKGNPEAEAERLDAQSNMPFSTPEKGRLRGLKPEFQLMIGLNREFLTTRIVDEDAFMQEVSEKGVVGTLQVPSTKGGSGLTGAEMPISVQVEGEGFAVTFGDDTILVPDQAGVIQKIRKIVDGIEDIFITLNTPENIEGQKRRPFNIMTDEFPIDDPKVQRILQAAKDTGMVSEINMVKEMMRDQNNEEFYGAYYPLENRTRGALLRAGFINLSPNITLNTIFHEMYHAYRDRVGQLDPELDALETELGKYSDQTGPEAAADIVGMYAADAILDPDVKTKVENYIAKLRVAATQASSSEEIARATAQRLLTKQTRTILTESPIPRDKATHGTDQVDQMYLDAERAEDARQKRVEGGWYDNLREGTWDSKGTVKALLRRGSDKEAGAEVIQKLELVAGASSRTVKFLNGIMPQIYGGLDGHGERRLGKMLVTRDLISRLDAAKKKSVNREMAVKYKIRQGIKRADLEEYLANWDPEDFAFYEGRANLYFQTTRELLDMVYTSGYYGKKEYRDLLMHQDYVTADHLNKDNPVDPLKEGKKGSYALRSVATRSLLAQYTTKAYETVVRNIANLGLYEYTKANPGFGPGRLSKGTDIAEHRKKVVGRANGKNFETWMPDKLHAQWTGSNALTNIALLKWLNTYSGVKVVKLFATGINPFFHLFYNPPMDWGRIIMFTNTYNKSLPKGVAQLASDLATTASDVWHRRGAYSKWADAGANQEFLTAQGLYKTGLGTKLATLQQHLSRLGLFTEAWSRVAQSQRELTKMGVTWDTATKAQIEKAAYISRTSLDYSQGGTWVKALDQVIPYLSAAVAGTRAAARYVTNNPKDFAIKFGQLAMTSMALAAANMMYDEYEEVSDYDKMNNFIIMTPWRYRTKDGSTGRHYLKIRKDQPLRPILYVTEQLLRWGMGKPVNPAAASKAAGQIINVLNIDPGNMPSTLRSMIALMSNYDMWRGEEIWKGAKGKMSDEYKASTPHLYRMLGAFTGASPVRLKVAANSLVSPSNPFVSLVGYGTEQLLSAMSPEERERTMHEVVYKDLSVVKGFVGTTDKRNRILSNVFGLREEEASKNINQNRELDRLTGLYVDDPTAERKKEVLTFIRKQPIIDKPRLVSRVKLHNTLAKIPDRGWWVSAKSDSPEIRAIRFYDRYTIAGVADKADLKRVARVIPGFITPRFRKALASMTRGASREALVGQQTQ